MYGAAIYDQAARGIVASQGSSDVQFSYSKVIHHLNEDMQHSQKACSDESIMAVLVMAANGLQDDTSQRSRKTPTQAPLSYIQSLAIYGALEIVPVHAEGMGRLIEMKGGLSEIKLKGLAETISW